MKVVNFMKVWMFLGWQTKKSTGHEIISTALTTTPHTALGTANPNLRPITCKVKGKAALFANCCRSSSASGSRIIRIDVLSSMRLVSITKLNLLFHIVGCSVDIL